MKNLTNFRKTVETCVDPRLKGESYPQSHNLQSEPRFTDIRLLNTDTSLLRTVYFIPGERKPLHFL